MGSGPSDVLGAIQKTVEREIAPDAPSVDRERRFPEEGLKALGAVGALGLVVPGEHGGAGGALSALAEACELIGSACASTAMVFLMHSVTAATISGAGGPRAGEVLEAMATGQTLGSLAFSERGTGAHFYAPELKAIRADRAIRVTGRKSFVTSGGHADVYLTLVQAEREGAADAYLLSSETPGLSADGAWGGLGMTGNSSVALEFDDVSLSDEDRIGAPGEAVGLVFGTVAPFFLVGLAAVNVGIAAAAAKAATDHATNRGYPDGSLLAEVQFIQHLIADMDTTTRQARLLVHEAARLGEAGDDSALVAIMEAKVAATEAATAVTQKALEATGGQGYTSALPIERHLRDARAGSVMAPTNAVLRSWIGKALAGLPVP
jgi:alkylation response protein AidB-like acyl-CoA dehydrogenase